MADHPLRRRIADVLDLAPDASAIECDGSWFTYGDLATLARRIEAVVGDRGQVGMVLRNRPAHIAAFLGVLLAGGTVVVINPSRGDDRTTADIAALDLPVIIGGTDDLAKVVGGQSGSTVVSISTLDAEPDLLNTGDGRNDARPDVAVRMLTSGTTGPPKRIDLTYDMLAHSVMGPAPERSPAPTEVRSGVAIVNAPLVHIGGVFRVLQCLDRGKAFRAARSFRPRQVGRRRAQASTTHGVPCARRTADGVALRPSPRGPRRASAPSPRAPHRCRQTMPTHSRTSSEFPC